MTNAEEISKLNRSQQRALRKALFGRGKAHLVYVNEKISKATVEFIYESGLHVAHHIMLGKRGRIVFHEVQKIA